MRISIVTPVLNGMPWLPEAVESVARQRLDVEHLIRDGGSTDGSREWLTAHEDLGYRATFDRDRGQTDALIAGFAAATGDIFGWLNADDLLEPGALRRVAEAFEANPDAVIVSGACLLIGPDGAVLGPIPTPPRPEFDRKPIDRLAAWTGVLIWPWTSTCGSGSRARAVSCSSGTAGWLASACAPTPRGFVWQPPRAGRISGSDGDMGCRG
jgi:glycosyltransferase involved in cell wall biosynthesis